MCKWKSRSNFDIFFQSYGIFLKAYLFRDIDNRKQNQETFGKKKLFLIALVFVNIFRGVHLEKYLSFRRSNTLPQKSVTFATLASKSLKGLEWEKIPYIQSLEWFGAGHGEQASDYFRLLIVIQSLPGIKKKI